MPGKKFTCYFNEIFFKPIYGKVKYRVFYVCENNKSEVLEAFDSLDENTKAQVSDLITKMATIENFQSKQIKYKLKSYDYGEVKPKPHRFFFFQKCGKNYIFFAYREKKKDSLGNKIYSMLNNQKENYEKEFQKFIERF